MKKGDQGKRLRHFNVNVSAMLQSLVGMMIYVIKQEGRPVHRSVSARVGDHAQNPDLS